MHYTSRSVYIKISIHWNQYTFRSVSQYAVHAVLPSGRNLWNPALMFELSWFQHSLLCSASRMSSLRRNLVFLLTNLLLRPLFLCDHVLQGRFQSDQTSIQWAPISRVPELNTASLFLEIVLIRSIVSDSRLTQHLKLLSINFLCMIILEALSGTSITKIWP